MNAETYLTTRQAATKLKVSVDHVVALIHSGSLCGIDVSTGRKPRWRIASADLDAFIAARTHKPIPAATRRRRKVTRPLVDYFA